MKSGNHALFFIFISFVFLTTGCSHWSNSQKRMASMGAGALAGAIIGAATTPSDESSATHALAGGATGGLAAAVAANFLFDSEKDYIEMKAENEKLRIQLDYIQSSYPTLLKESKASQNPIDTKKGSLTIRLYKIDEWITESPTKKFHRDQMIEVLPNEKGR